MEGTLNQAPTANGLPAGPTPAEWRQLHLLRDRWNAERLGAGRAPLPDDDQTRRLLALIWRDAWRDRRRDRPTASRPARDEVGRRYEPSQRADGAPLRSGRIPASPRRSTVAVDVTSMTSSPKARGRGRGLPSS